MARPGSVTGLRRVPREAAEATKAACAASVRGDATALTAALRELTAVLRAPGSRAALLDARDATGETLLIHATRAGSEECVRLLLRHGASPHAADASGVTPLHVACAEADLRLVEAIVDSTARRPRGSFAIACTTLQLTPLHYLALSPKATSASPEVVHSIVRTIVEACSARAAFIRGHVANNSSAEPWVAFVHSTVDAYLYLAQGMTPLIAAAAAGSAPVVGALLRQCPETVRDAQTDTQFTALHWAAALSRDKCAMLLLAAEANPEARARCTRPGSGRECDVSARHIAEHGLTFLPSMPPPRDLRGLPVPNAERMLEVLDWAPAPAAERRIPDRVARTEAQRAVIWAEATEVDTTYRLVPHAGSRRGFGRRESDEEPVVTDETPAYHPEDDADEATRAAIDAETPDELRCPISLQLFRDPVIASDMHTYERRAIEAWQLKRGTSPLTGLDMPDVTVPLIPNVVFRNRADAIRARHGVKPGMVPGMLPGVVLLLAAVIAAHALAACAGDTPRHAAASRPILLLDLGLHSPAPSLATQIAVQACVGLMNRASDPMAPWPYVLMEPADEALLTTVVAPGAKPVQPTPPATFLHQCLHGTAFRGAHDSSGVDDAAWLAPVARGVLRYDAAAMKAILPNVIALAGVLDAVPLEADDPAGANATIVFDATATLHNMTAAQATAYVYDNHVNSTTSMAMMDPGYDGSSNPFNPPLTRTLNVADVDFVVQQRLFSFFMWDACIPGTEEHTLMERMVAVDGKDKWPRPVPVYGYNDAWPLLGAPLFEAQTTCVAEHNLGEVCTLNTTNLSFFSRVGPITTPLQQVQRRVAMAPLSSSSSSVSASAPGGSATVAAGVYNASKTYMTLVVGDGDNLSYIKSTRFEWMLTRVQRCKQAQDDAMCYPLVWTLSPHALQFTPELARWYYAQARLTGADYFAMPPSGDQYAYPGQMSATDQATFVAATQRDGWLLNTSATTHWEFFGTWADAFKTYFPRYAVSAGSAGGNLDGDVAGQPAQQVRGFFAVNVPFMLPQLPFWGDNETYKLVAATSGSSGGTGSAGDDTGAVVVFRQREWRGTGSTTIPFAHAEYLTPDEMAAEINGYAPGTVGHIYLTSDGGCDVGACFDALVARLAEHVAVVDQDTAVRMALARG